METRRAKREKAARRRRLSEKIGAALMAGSLAWTPGGPLSWAVVLGGGIMIARQETAYAQETSGVISEDQPTDVSGDNGSDTDGVSVTVCKNGGSSESPVIGSGGTTGTVYGILNTTNGGLAQSAAVTIDTGLMYAVYGGYITSSGTAKLNSVTVNGGLIGAADGYVCGGHVSGGTAEGNRVIVSGGTIGSTTIGGSANGTVCGGYASSGMARNNSVSVCGGYIGLSRNQATGCVYGGYVENGTASSNSVTLNGGTIGVTSDGGGNDAGIGRVYGGYVSSGGTAEDNTVTISSGIIGVNSGYVYGGYAQNGTARNNRVIMKGGQVDPPAPVTEGHLYGGCVSSGTAEGNTVTLSGGTVGNNSGYAYGGYVSGGGTAKSNSVTVSGGTIGAYYNRYTGSGGIGIACGGYVSGGIAEGNRVTISGGTIGMGNGYLYGGYVSGGTASGNTVTISGGMIGNSGGYARLYGGYAAASGTVDNNTVIVCGGTFTDNGAGEAYGGWAEGGTASGNVVSICGGTLGCNELSGNICGGYVASSTQASVGKAADNQVVIDHIAAAGTTEIGYDIVGGYVSGSAAIVSGNCVTIRQTSGITSVAASAVCGGRAESGTVSSNTVTISGGTIGMGTGTVYGGYVSGGTASGNMVTISGGMIGTTGYAYLYGGYAAASGTVDNNTVIVCGGTFTDDGDGKAYGGWAKGGTASGNAVSICGGTLGRGEGNICGGYVDSSTQASVGEAADNQVVIDHIAAGGTTEIGDDIAGGYVSGSAAIVSGNCVTIRQTSGITSVAASAVCGGGAESGTVSSNTVTISGGTIDGAVYGGTAKSGTVSSNTVTISGGTISSSIYGGAVSSGTATGNTVNFYGGSIGQTLYGGFSETDTDDVTTGNTLNIGSKRSRVAGLSADNIANFQNLNFYLPSSIADGASVLTLRTIEGTALGSEHADVSINAYLDGNTNLAVGSEIKLINKTGTGTLVVYTGGTEQDTGTLGTAKVWHGVTATTSAAVSIGGDDGNDLMLTAVAAITPTSGGTLPEQTKSIAETRADGAAFLNGGADMLAGQGIAAAVDAALAPGNSGSPSANTADTGGSSQGSGDGDRLAQTASGAANRAHYTLYVPFAATGGNNMRYNTGSHVDSHGWNATLGFARAIVKNGRTLTFGPLIEHGRSRYDSYLDDGTHGSGNTRYTGAGILARLDMAGGVYYEGSLRAGRIHSDYQALLHAGGDITAPLVASGYDTDSTYYALHLGIGRVLRLSQANCLDVYGKYFFSHEGSDDVQLSTGDPYHFDAVTSQRLRLGARFSHQVNRLSTFYVGTAFEYEFDAESRATYKGAATPSPSMKGMSGMLELGWRMKPNVHSPLTIDLGTSAWIGKQQGYTLNAQFQWVW